MLNQDLIDAIDGSPPFGFIISDCIAQLNDINAPNEAGATYLSLAASTPEVQNDPAALDQRLQIIQALLNAGADPCIAIQEESYNGLSVFESLLIKVMWGPLLPHELTLFNSEVFDAILQRMTDIPDLQFSQNFIEAVQGAPVSDFSFLTMVRGKLPTALQDTFGACIIYLWIHKKLEEGEGFSNIEIGSYIEGLPDFKNAGLLQSFSENIARELLGRGEEALFYVLHRAKKVSLFLGEEYNPLVNKAVQQGLRDTYQRFESALTSGDITQGNIVDWLRTLPHAEVLHGEPSRKIAEMILNNEEWRPFFEPLYRNKKVIMPTEAPYRAWANIALLDGMQRARELQVRSVEPRLAEDTAMKERRNSLSAGWVNKDYTLELLLEAIEKDKGIDVIKRHVEKLVIQSEAESLECILACREKNNKEALCVLSDSGKIVIPNSGGDVLWATNVIARRNKSRRNEEALKKARPEAAALEMEPVRAVVEFDKERVAAFKSRGANRGQPDAVEPSVQPIVVRMASPPSSLDLDMVGGDARVDRSRSRDCSGFDMVNDENDARIAVPEPGALSPNVSRLFSAIAGEFSENFDYKACISAIQTEDLQAFILIPQSNLYKALRKAVLDDFPRDLQGAQIEALVTMRLDIIRALLRQGVNPSDAYIWMGDETDRKDDVSLWTSLTEMLLLNLGKMTAEDMDSSKGQFLISALQSMLVREYDLSDVTPDFRQQMEETFNLESLMDDFSDELENLPVLNGMLKECLLYQREHPVQRASIGRTESPHSGTGAGIPGATPIPSERTSNASSLRSIRGGVALETPGLPLVPVPSPMGSWAKFFTKLAIGVALALTSPLWVPAMLIAFALKGAGLTDGGALMFSYLADQIERQWPDSAASQSPQRQYVWNNGVPRPLMVQPGNEVQVQPVPQQASSETEEVIVTFLWEDEVPGEEEVPREDNIPSITVTRQ